MIKQEEIKQIFLRFFAQVFLKWILQIQITAGVTAFLVW